MTGTKNEGHTYNLVGRGVPHDNHLQSMRFVWICGCDDLMDAEVIVQESGWISAL